MDPKGLPSAYFRSFQRWENTNLHLVVALAMLGTKGYGPNGSLFASVHKYFELSIVEI